MWLLMVDCCQGVAMQLLGCSGRLSGHCYVIARLLYMVFRVLLCSCSGVLDCCQCDFISGILGGCQGVAMRLASVFWMVNNGLISILLEIFVNSQVTPVVHGEIFHTNSLHKLPCVSQ